MSFSFSNLIALFKVATHTPAQIAEKAPEILQTVEQDTQKVEAVIATGERYLGLAENLGTELVGLFQSKGVAADVATDLVQGVGAIVASHQVQAAQQASAS